METPKQSAAYELNVYERMMLLQMLPQQGDMTTLRIIRELRDNLSFSEEEHALLKFGNDEVGRTRWAPEGANQVGEKQVAIGAKATEIIAAALKELEAQKKLHIDHLPLWDKFVENGETKSL